jgi:hypothetical protein
VDGSLDWCGPGIVAGREAVAPSDASSSGSGGIFEGGRGGERFGMVAGIAVAANALPIALFGRFPVVDACAVIPPRFGSLI